MTEKKQIYSPGWQPLYRDQQSQHFPAIGSFPKLNSRSLQSNTAYYFEGNFKKLFWSLLKHPTALRFPDTLSIMVIEIGDIDDESSLCNYQRRYNYCFNLNTLRLTNKTLSLRDITCTLTMCDKSPCSKLIWAHMPGVLWDYNNWKTEGIFEIIFFSTSKTQQKNLDQIKKWKLVLLEKSSSQELGVLRQGGEEATSNTS